MNTIQQINSINNSPNFGKLHKVKFSKNFNINSDKQCANIYKTFNESYTFKRFFDEYDVIADFSYYKNDNSGFLNFYISKINKKANNVVDSFRELLKNKKFKLVNIIATTNYNTMAKDIQNMDLDDLLLKAEKKSKSMNISEKIVFDNIIENSSYKKEKSAVIIESANNVEPKEISDLSKKLLTKTSDVIESIWTEQRKNNKNIHNLDFNFNKKNEKINLKPVYINNSKFILLEIDNGNEIIKININSRTFDYKYEKIKKTEFGSATVKMVDSRIKKDSENIKFVSNILETYLPKFNKKFEPKY